MEMRAKARRLKMEAGLDMIMVDYLQLMAVKGKIESRQQEISQISRGLKAIAKELDVPVLSLSQLSRRPEQRTGDHRPQLSDLRESGSIEQDADSSASSTATRSTTRRRKRRASPRSSSPSSATAPSATSSSSSATTSPSSSTTSRSPTICPQ